jgi:hypothetical protein
MIITNKVAALTATLTTAMSLLAAPAMAFSVGATNNIETLKDNLLGTNTVGLSNFSLSITGDARAFGIFNDDPFDLTSGVVMSTGKVTDIPGPNLEDGTAGTDFPPSGVEEGDLAQLNLSFFADSTAEKLFFKYVFGSEEFLEYGGSEYNDSFEMLLNGTNLAKLTDGKTVTINNLVPDKNNRSKDHPDYINNPSFTGLAANIIRLDGYTKVLGFEGLLKQNQTNVLTIRIKDVGDGTLDSAVFIQGDVGTIDPDETVPEPMTVGGLMAGGAMLAAGRKLRARRK